MERGLIYGVWYPLESVFYGSRKEMVNSVQLSGRFTHFCSYLVEFAFGKKSKSPPLTLSQALSKNLILLPSPKTAKKKMKKVVYTKEGQVSSMQRWVAHRNPGGRRVPGMIQPTIFKSKLMAKQRDELEKRLIAMSSALQKSGLVLKNLIYRILNLRPQLCSLIWGFSDSQSLRSSSSSRVKNQYDGRVERG